MPLRHSFTTSPTRLFLLLSLAYAALSSPHPLIHPRNHHLLQRRNVVAADQLQDTYDFVVVGGGTAGLALASRLSEDANTTVLVIEAGDTGDAALGTIDVPANAYYQSLLSSSSDWAYPVLAQPNLNNRAIVWPRGKVLGGSSAINGMYSVRPSQIEVDAWVDLVAQEDSNAANNWGWNEFLAGMKKSETFVAPSTSIEQTGNIEFDAASHGSSGPLFASYPGYMPSLVGNWTPSLAALGVPESPDAYSGQTWGSFIATSNINPNNWTRSYSRSAYIDSLPYRANLEIVTNSTVTRLIFGNSTTSGNLTATAVEFATDRTATRSTVNVTKEVLLAAGAIGSPHILMHSGVGPSDVLKSAGVAVVSELPGVGQHLQDHVSTELTFNTTAETAGEIHAAGTEGSVPGGTSAFLSFVNSATAYVNITALFGTSAESFQSNVSSALDSSVATLVPSQDASVIAGYKAIYNVSQTLLNSPLGHVEILLSLTAGDIVAIQLALQRPFSQGYLYINSDDPFNYPLIDPRYLSHSADKSLLREAAKFARQLAQMAPLSTQLTGETAPGSAVQSDADWDNWIAQTIGTEFHPSSTCAMLPLNLGGVVDTNLKVYGLSNVRVVDASIFPIQFAAHLMAPVYGLAEQAANIIRAQYNNPPPSSSNSSSSSAPASSASPSAGSQHKSGASISAAFDMPFMSLFTLAALLCSSLIF
ncbi:GMC oxidoreductase [Artomyces pyxidatus]|uniref:GMC oxidoreductase n=1 Tax=Artomyces pyxidatus TaxID=48021 RepID=A0ACB8TK42_9AGAM|nr:GMC oxidoreductase [Artomyces pyxidatus]